MESVFVNSWKDKWVKLTYFETGMNQMAVTEYQVITKLKFVGFKVQVEPNSLIRRGHPCKEDAEYMGLPYINDQKWTWARIRLDLKLVEDEVYDYDNETTTKEWKLMRETEMMGFETMQALEIEAFDMTTLDSSVVMPPPNKCRIKF
jgi:hypothetical protein